MYIYRIHIYIYMIISCTHEYEHVNLYRALDAHAVRLLFGSNTAGGGLFLQVLVDGLVLRVLVSKKW